MSQSNTNGVQPPDDADRRNRFVSGHGSDSGPQSLRERAASQPPRTSGQNFLPPQPGLSPNLGRGSSPWASQRFTGALPTIPTRSSSFSATAPGLQGSLSSLHEGRAFTSTFEDDESEALSDTYDERYVPPSLPARGRSYAADLTRSRSQSLATTSRPQPIGSPLSSGLPPWGDSSLGSNPLSIPGSRYGEIKPPGGSRYGSLGATGRSPSNFSSSPTGAPMGNGYSRSRQQVDASNMSPFMRDVGQILLDDGSAFRELWSGMNPPRDENGGGGSGTTSRRHSVSVVQPRRGIVGFNAPGLDTDEPTRPIIFPGSSYGRGGLLLTDEDLASDLNLMSLSRDGPGPTTSSNMPPSQPSSLPIYAPLSRSPPTAERLSPYQPLNLSIPGGSFSSRQAFGSPSEGGVSSGESSAFNQPQDFVSQQQQHPSNLAARFIPGQGIQYIAIQTHDGVPASYGRGAGLTSPISPTSGRTMHGMFAPSAQRRPSESGGAPANLSELGKGVPLHAVPASCPLYIVEFKAGRTDLFYATDLALDIRVGDLVIVEADRGKDLGKVVNDTITLAEVEAFQRQQLARAGGDAPVSPGGTTGPPSAGAKKEINPKMIYGKAGAQDTQLLVTKIQDEMKALQLCQTKVRQKKLPMEVIDAEYQWDRRKLTFYFIAEKRIDFRELVRELFRLYKTRIWMASLQGPGYDQ